MNTFLRSLLLTGGLAVAALPVSAQTMVVFSNFDTGDTYNASTLNAVTGSDSILGTAYTQAMSFTASSGGTLSSLELALKSYFGPAAVDVSLCSNAGGAPGAVLEAWTGPSFTNPAGAIYSYVSTGTPVELSAGTSYWIVAAPGTSTTWAGWAASNVAQSQGEVSLYNVNGGAYLTYSAYRGTFRVAVSAIPEPSTYAALFGVATLGLVAWRRRAKR